MQQPVMIYPFRGQDVRVVMQGGNPWFVAKDVCQVLDLTGDPGQHTRRLWGDEKGLISIQTPGGFQQVQAVNEPGLYTLVLGSRKPEAREFKRWITHEVLPAIRKTGAYSVQEFKVPQSYAEALRLAADQAEQIERQQATIQLMAPKAEFHDRVAESVDCQSIGEVAKVLGTGQNRFFRWLRNEKILLPDNQPYQEYIDRGYFRVIEQNWQDGKGKERVTPKTLVTGKGLTYLQRRYQEQERRSG